MRLIIGISLKLIVRQEYNTTIAFSYILHSNIEHRTVRAGLKTLHGHINTVSNYCAHSGYRNRLPRAPGYRHIFVTIQL